MKRDRPWEQTVIPCDDSSDSDSSDSGSSNDVKLKSSKGVDGSSKDKGSEGVLLRRAELYQQYMHHLKIPSRSGSIIPFTSWHGLGKSMKQLYGQPLHYHTNVLLKQWDVSRIGTAEEHLPLDSIIHPVKAETLIWSVEEIHRLTSSYHSLAKIWASDPLHHAFVDRFISQR